MCVHAHLCMHGNQEAHLMICIALPNIVIASVCVLQEICDNPEWISSGASRFDVRQGELGKQKVEVQCFDANVFR